MTSDTTAAPRANSKGDPCPAWCTTDHDELLLAGKPEYGHVDIHASDPMSPALWPGVIKVRRYLDNPATVEVDRYGVPGLAMLPEQAVILADVVSADGPNQVADDLRAAAAIARDAK